MESINLYLTMVGFFFFFLNSGGEAEGKHSLRIWKDNP